MKRILLFCLALSIFGSEASAQTIAPIDYQGNAWETGGFLPSDAGDIFNVVGVVDNINPIFPINLGTTELTVWATNLSSTGQVPIGGGFWAISYLGGRLELYDDPSKNHDYGTFPPNALSPSTFTDGTLFLGGALMNFIVFFDSNTGSGAYEGFVTFDSGSALATVQGIQTDGFTFGAILDSEATAGSVILGYDLQLTGIIEVRVTVPVQKMTWSRVKNLYSQR